MQTSIQHHPSYPWGAGIYDQKCCPQSILIIYSTDCWVIEISTVEHPSTHDDQHKEESDKVDVVLRSYTVTDPWTAIDNWRNIKNIKICIFGAIQSEISLKIFKKKSIKNISKKILTNDDPASQHIDHKHYNVLTAQVFSLSMHYKMLMVQIHSLLSQIAQ